MIQKLLSKYGILCLGVLILVFSKIEGSPGVPEKDKPVSLETGSVMTLGDTYLGTENGSIMGDIGPFLLDQHSKKHLTEKKMEKSQEKKGEKKEEKKKGPVLLFGKFKKFGNSPQEVVQVVWTEMGVETKKEVKKELVLAKVESIFRYKSSILPKLTKLKLKGDLKALKVQGDHFLEIQRQNLDSSQTLKKKERVLKIQNSQENDSTFDQHDEKKSVREGLSRNSDAQVQSTSQTKDKDTEKEEQHAKDQQSDRQESGNSDPQGQRAFHPSSRKRQGQEFIPLKIDSKEPKKEKSLEKPSPSDTIDVEILKEGCSPRIDEIQELVMIQTRSLTRKNGKVIKEEPCSDSNEHYPIRKRYEGCADKVSKEQGIACPQYQRFWIDGAGTIQEIDRSCIVDAENPFELREDEKACEVIPDFTSMVAERRAQLYYKDRKHRRIIVDDCRALTGVAPLRLEKVTCGYRHDFEGGLSYLQSRIIALREGQEVRITPCSDEGEPLKHQISTVGCDPIIEAASKRRFAQVRTIIETSQGPLLITPCRPSQELQETSEGCETKFDHDLEAGQSRGYTRFFHEIRDIKTYVTDCQPSSNSFEHQRRLKGYEHNDELKSSRPKTEIYIKVPYAGEVLVDSEKVREDDPAIGYTPKEIKEELDPREVKFEGCFKITPQKRIQVYIRPDQTIFEEIIGEGMPLKSGNLCKISEETSEHKSSSWYTDVCGKPCSDVHWPAGSYDGAWLSCGEARSRAPWGNANVRCLVYHSSFLEKRLKTEFPSGDVSFSDWERITPTQNVRTQNC